MKLSRLNTMVVGILIIFAGIGLFLDGLGLIHFSIFDLWPVILIYFGMTQWSKNRRLVGGILLGLGVLFLLEFLFDISFKIVFPMLIIYFGFRMIRSRQTGEKIVPEIWRKTEAEKQEEHAPDEQIIQKEQTAAGAHVTTPYGRMRIETPARPGGDTRSSLIGDFHLTSGRFELRQLLVWHGIGDVVIDLSRALIGEEEAILVVNGWVGDVTIYVPVDLPISVAAEVTIGDLKVLGHRQGGLNRCVVMRSEDYEHALRKVKLNISLIVGDVDVKYI